jgi:hypothetical protein
MSAFLYSAESIFFMVPGGYRGPRYGKTFLHLLQRGKSLKIFAKTQGAKKKSSNLLAT